MDKKRNVTSSLIKKQTIESQLSLKAGLLRLACSLSKMFDVGLKSLFLLYVSRQYYLLKCSAVVIFP